MRLTSILVIAVIGFLVVKANNKRHPPWKLLRVMVWREIKITRRTIEELEDIEDDEGLDELQETHKESLQTILTELRKVFKQVKKQVRKRYCDRDKFEELDDLFKDQVDDRLDIVDEAIDDGFRGLKTWDAVEKTMEKEKSTKTAAYRSSSGKKKKKC